VTVFEELSHPGVMMRDCITVYRLPKDVLDTEIKVIKDVGVDIKVNSKIENLDSLFNQGYNAVFVAIGAHKPVKVRIAEKKNSWLIESLSLLKKVNQGEKLALGARVAVIGGGNSAVDAARTALRLGSKDVTIVYRRNRADMPANQSEVEQALYEGVKMQFLTVTSDIKKVDQGIRLQCVRVGQGKLDESLRPQTESITGSEFNIDVDSVISAIGEVPDVPRRFGLDIKGGTLQVEGDSVVTSKTGVFAGGDAVTGPASVIEAIAAGRKAAISIDEYLGGIGMIDETLLSREGVAPMEPSSLPGRRALTHLLPVNERLNGFDEVDAGLTEEVAIEQAKRCLRCDLPITVDATKCTGCRTCQLWCSFRYEKAFYPSRAEIDIEDPEQRELGFGISFTNVCDVCGICARYCPTGALSR
jgi:NADPH-dependent glutamate synthase beta subunit-like oxidoreductase